MRILIFSPYFAPHVGGLESFVGEFNEALLRDGDVECITVLTAHLPGTATRREHLGPRYRVARYPAVEVIPNFPFPKLWSLSFWRSLRAADPVGHDLLVSHTRFFLSSLLALVCARVTGRPLIHVEHGSDFVQLDSRANRVLARIYDHVLGRFVLRKADAVVAVSSAAADFVRLLAHRESPVVYRGLSLLRLEPVSPDTHLLERADGRPIVTFVGRLIDGKGVADLIHAFASVDSGGPVLSIVGDGPRRGDLERLAERLGIGDRVLFMGYLREPDVLATILASDVIVNPSYTEGLPTTVLEAAAMGRAVLATDVGGTREVVTDGSTGILFAARDVTSLTRELKRLLDDPELRRRLGAAAQDAVPQRFDWEASVHQFLDVARAVAGPYPETRYQST